MKDETRNQYFSAHQNQGKLQYISIICIIVAVNKLLEAVDGFLDTHSSICPCAVISALQPGFWVSCVLFAPLPLLNGAGLKPESCYQLNMCISCHYRTVIPYHHEHTLQNSYSTGCCSTGPVFMAQREILNVTYCRVLCQLDINTDVFNEFHGVYCITSLMYSLHEKQCYWTAF